MGFNAKENTLNGLIMKLSTSLFFRNLDRVLYLGILEDIYFLNDEVHAKVRTDSAKLTAEFIRDCWVWGMLSVNFGLVRYSSEGGSRCYKVAYALLSELDRPIFIQSDAYGCYVNLGEKELITRLGCLQHTARRYKNLESPIAKKITEMFRGLYHLDHQRIEQAANDALIGKEWKYEDHLTWRGEKMLPAFNAIIDYINEVLATTPEMDDKNSSSSVQPLSKALRNAMNYTLNEAEAHRNIFRCGIICSLDQNEIYHNFLSIPTY